jgi:hypothetical protein
MFGILRATKFALGLLLLGATSLSVAGCTGSTGNYSAPNQSGGNASAEDPFAIEDYQKGFNWGSQAAANNPFRQSGRERCNDLWNRATGTETLDAAVWMNGCLDGFSGSVGGGTATTPDGGGQVVDEVKQYYDDGYEFGRYGGSDPNSVNAAKACEPVNSYQEDENWQKGCAKGFNDYRKSPAYITRMKERYDAGFDTGFRNGPTYISATPEEACQIDMGDGADGELERNEQFRGCVAGIKKWRQENPS